MAREQGDLLHVGRLRVQREIPHLHVFGHALPKGCHGKLLCEMECAASSHSMLSQRNQKGRKPDQLESESLEPQRSWIAIVPRSGLVQLELCGQVSYVTLSFSSSFHQHTSEPNAT